MDPLAKEYLLSFYSKQLMLHGDRPEALRWTPDGQKARYNLLTEIAPSLEGKKILDHGCGKGDFYAFLREKGLNVDYTGTDINPELIALASKKHPECSFRVFDAEEEEPGEEFDYVFLCGVFNNRVEGAADTLKNVIKRLFKNTREGLAVTALSSLSPEKDRELNYVSPAELLNFALEEITPCAVLRHDRVPHDFALFLYQRPTAPENGDRA